VPDPVPTAPQPFPLPPVIAGDAVVVDGALQTDGTVLATAVTLA
jgi:hypothetical protein